MKPAGHQKQGTMGRGQSWDVHRTQHTPAEVPTPIPGLQPASHGCLLALVMGLSGGIGLDDGLVGAHLMGSVP